MPQTPTINKFKWDKWQQEVLAHKGNITVRSGRQVGKSEVISQKAFNFATENPGTTTLIIAASQRQSSLLFEKVRVLFDLSEQEGKNNYLEKPTLTKILLKNGSRIYSLPAGRTGYFIRGFTIDLLIADEAAYIPETVWLAVTPMLAVSQKLRKFGWTILLSTPFGKGGYYFHSFTDPDFKAFHVSSEDCPRIPKDFLKKEKERMTKAEYRQEYLGEFTDEWNQFFSTDLIKKAMTFISWEKDKDYIPNARYYLGVDVARYGGDENAFVICEMFENKFKIIKCETTSRVSTTDTISRIESFDSIWNFNKIFIDDAGLGGSLTDILISRLGRKVMGLNNASKRIQIQGEEKKKGILKEDLYSNALMLLETGKLELISDLALLRSLKSITYEYGEMKSGTKSVKIYGDYAHLAEAMVRACWCLKERGLDIYIY
jgi:hypothetical protein